MTKTNRQVCSQVERDRARAVRETIGSMGKSPVQIIIANAFKYTCEVVTLWLFIMVVFMICLYISGA